MTASGFASANLPASELNQIRGSNPQAEVELAYGWDTTRFGPAAQIGGTSFLTNFGVGSIPTSGSDGLYAYLQADAIKTIKLIGRSRFFARAAAGASQGSRFGRRFFLSSFDNLRGFRWATRGSSGDGYYVGQAELQFPLERADPDRAVQRAHRRGRVRLRRRSRHDRAVQNHAGHGYTKLHAASRMRGRTGRRTTSSASTWVWDRSSCACSSPTGSTSAEWSRRRTRRAGPPGSRTSRCTTCTSSWSQALCFRGRSRSGALAS